MSGTTKDVLGRAVRWPIAAARAIRRFDVWLWDQLAPPFLVRLDEWLWGQVKALFRRRPVRA